MRAIAYALLLFATSAFPQDRTLQFAGEVSRGQEYRKEFGSALVFLLKPNDSGWRIAIIPKQQCEQNEDWASVVNPPYRGYNPLHLDSSYGITAKEAVAINPREFSFVLTCEDYKRESRRLEIVLWPYNYSRPVYDDALANLGTSPQGKATLTILQSKVSRADEDVEGRNYGRIDWLKFNVEISLASKRRSK